MFKQLFDEVSCTLTYLIADDATKEAVIIDPVDTKIDEYWALIEAFNLNLLYALETHVHADHVTASGKLRQRLGLKTAVSQRCGAESADLQLNEGDVILFGQQCINVIATPGHTAGSVFFMGR